MDHPLEAQPPGMSLLHGGEQRRDVLPHPLKVLAAVSCGEVAALDLQDEQRRRICMDVQRVVLPRDHPSPAKRDRRLVAHPGLTAYVQRRLAGRRREIKMAV